jgi:hypothetical protein
MNGVPGPECHIAKYLAIRAKCDLVFGASIQIVKDNVGQPPLRQSPKVMDVNCFRELMGAERLGHDSSQ